MFSIAVLPPTFELPLFKYIPFSISKIILQKKGANIKISAPYFS
ncbi:hypothetical protein D081_0633 [Anaerovibrio sp. JC8]|nr:hypothetical protein D081_0633 [Anaerovibrio sp. JC8]